MVAGGGGPAGEKREGTEGCLRVVLARREKAGGGGSMVAGGRQYSGGGRKGRRGSRASAARGEASGVVHSSNAGVGRRRHGMLELAGVNGGPDSGLHVRGKGGLLLWLESLRG